MTQMKTVKIYGVPMAVCPQRVMLCLVEKAVPFEIIYVDLDKMEQKEPKYMAKQPFGQVPYIEDGDFGLYESRAIIRYYAAKYTDQGPDLLGGTLEERARVDQWLDIEAMNYNPVVFPIVLNLFIIPKMGGVGNRAEAESFVEKLGKVLDVLNEQLAKTKYLAGDKYTLADITFIPATQYLVEFCGMAHLIDERKHVKVWWDDITGRPAWKTVLSIAEVKGLSYLPSA
uniref:glutathione transferase n=1 Tax=Lilium hybrid cultivar TaxID=156531 RepID=A0A5B9G8S8_9LILI|nr:anthocyanin-related glutathione S-transferase [Lilium hybrid cultivar]